MNAITLVEIAKQKLQAMRENGWDSLFCETVTFCKKHNISDPDMDSIWIPRGRPCRRKAEGMKNLHHYHVEFSIQLLICNSTSLILVSQKSYNKITYLSFMFEPEGNICRFGKEKNDMLSYLVPYRFLCILSHKTWQSTRNLYCRYALKWWFFTLEKNWRTCWEIGTNKEGWYVSLSLQAFEISISLPGCYNNHCENILRHEYYKKIDYAIGWEISGWMISCPHISRRTCLIVLILKHHSTISRHETPPISIRWFEWLKILWVLCVLYFSEKKM